MPEHVISSPGDDGTMRLVMHAQAYRGSTLKLENGSAQGVLFLEMHSRTLASVEERDTRAYGLSYEQAAVLAWELLELLDVAGFFDPGGGGAFVN